ncbi:MAG: helix-turn-helix transcriptional regulator [Fulvivirga sp.]|uniref:helix-turn-helix domain-containing protein n=1 Tax=Fulvivirga sp. TaxID=1931237 RepID=UPI0032ED09F8
MSKKLTGKQEIDWIAVGARIIFERTKKRISQSELAENICVHPSALSKYERGQREIPVMACLRLSRALNITLNQLLELPDHERNYSPIGDKIARRVSEWNLEWQEDINKVVHLYELIHDASESSNLKSVELQSIREVLRP